jgi:Rhamnan synthesis protein F
MGGPGVIPKWKVRREFNRLGEQIQALLSYPMEPYYKWKHDRSLLKNVILVDGSIPLSSKVAIYLVYQPRGILESTILTCKHLSENGYSVLVVSNTGLTPEDLGRLGRFSWRIAIRPNFGYDFGGYRDGIRLLSEGGVEPESLVILNDSIWWPIFPGDTILDRMENDGADVVGTIMHHKPGRRKQSNSRPAFLESYFFWFNRRALTSVAFRDFWKKYRISSIKYNAVHRGERRLTAALAQGGLTVKGLFSRESLVQALRSQSHDEVMRTVRYGAYIDPDFRARADALLAEPQSDDLTKRAIDFIDSSTVRRGFHASFSYASVKLLGATFLKKAPAQANGSMHHVMRQKVLDATEAGDLPPMIDAINAEIVKRQIEGAAAVGR